MSNEASRMSEKLSRRIVNRLLSLHKVDTAITIAYHIRRIIYRDGKYIFLTAMPKSGSTFLSNALAEITGYSHSYLAFDYFNVEQELYKPRMVDSYGVGTVVQQHMKANEPNLNLLRRFNIRPIVMVRNIFDVVISVRDHLHRESLHNLPGLYVSDNFKEYSEEKQIDFIITYYVPWYVSFYASWCQAEEHGKTDVFWVVYDEIIKDWVAGIKSILEHVDSDTDESLIRESVARIRSMPDATNRINKGMVGRGRKILSEAQRKKIAGIAREFELTNYGRIGLDD